MHNALKPNATNQHSKPRKRQYIQTRLHKCIMKHIVHAVSDTGYWLYNYAFTCIVYTVSTSICWFVITAICYSNYSTSEQRPSYTTDTPSASYTDIILSLQQNVVLEKKSENYTNTATITAENNSDTNCEHCKSHSKTDAILSEVLQKLGKLDEIVEQLQTRTTFENSVNAVKE
ncbi:hypothetical protein PR048_010821 [Dryococelus australis]|uniref:Uncharacterized protein n=1 Tax=Dryococelus australis TaxID=614101 RepID=A0ABQ9I3T3_9NEOP|nr:hypothetical protein PR048_010821 [Dryococelus australis]